MIPSIATTQAEVVEDDDIAARRAMTEMMSEAIPNQLRGVPPVVGGSPDTRSPMFGGGDTGAGIGGVLSG
jgi:hypothetical protein